MIDLDSLILEQLHKVFAPHLGQVEVLVYGSRVNGAAHATSDLDLVVRCPSCPQKSYEGFAVLKSKLMESNIPILVDLVDWACIPEHFQNAIEQYYQVLFSYAP